MASILVVDDTRDVCRAMARLLRQVGHDATTAFSGEEAMDMLLADPGKLPDLVILDQMMPGLDGMQVLLELRNQARTRELPVVIFSALCDAQFQLHAIAKGANAYWCKGAFEYSTVAEKVQAVLSPHSL